MSTANRSVTICVILLMAMLSLGCQPIGTPTPEPSDAIPLPEIKGPEMERYIGETVTVEGVFVRDPVPLLVTDLDLSRINTPIPELEYILLVGDEAEELDPNDLGGALLRVTGTVVPAENYADDDNAQKTVALADIYIEMLERRYPYAPRIVEIDIEEASEPKLDRYAILFSGGSNSTHNHARYWNDLKFMYKTLVGPLKFSKDNIAVLYADKKAPDKQIPVHYAATQADLAKVFDMLRTHADEKDLVFFFTTNHGGGFNKADSKKKYLYGGQIDIGNEEPNDALLESDYKLDVNLDGDKEDTFAWDESLVSWGSAILDDDLQTIVADLEYDNMVIVMGQCFSAGLIHDMAQGSDRVIMSAAGEYEFSWARSDGTYDEFLYHFISAVNKADPGGNKVDADADNDGDVSMVEAFNYARANDAESETPWYEDSGDGIPHSGAMPGHGEGTLGKSITLEP